MKKQAKQEEQDTTSPSLNEWMDMHPDPRDSVVMWSKIYKKDLCKTPCKCGKCDKFLKLKAESIKLLKKKDKKNKKITTHDLFRLVKVMK